MRSTLMHHTEQPGEPGSFQLQNDRMLKVDLAGTGGFFYARQGSMVAYQGDVDFAYEGSGGVAPTRATSTSRTRARAVSPRCSRRPSRARACPS